MKNQDSQFRNWLLDPVSNINVYLFIILSFNYYYRDAIITCCVNTGTCLFAGCVTFSILGHMAYNQVNLKKNKTKKNIPSYKILIFMSLIFLQGVSVDDVVNSGPGLVFITYPEVVLKLPGGPIWAFIFFIMLVVGNLFIYLIISRQY